MRKNAVILAFGLGSLTAVPSAYAVTPGTGGSAFPHDDPVLVPAPSERRDGLVLGASGGLALGSSSGYPNNARLRDNPDFYSSSPLLAGWSTSYFLMGALTDWLSFGPTFTLASFETEKWTSSGWGAGFRAEVFPLLPLIRSHLPALADTAVYAQVGVGSAELYAKGPYPTSDGTSSFFTLGAHHEWRLTRLLGGHAAAGPQLDYNLITAPSIDRHWMSIGLRVVWYGGSVALDRN